MYLVGFAENFPPWFIKRIPMKVEKKRQMSLVGSNRCKSAKDFNAELGRLVVSQWYGTGGPLGLLGSAAEIGYRVPMLPRVATIPVSITNRRRPNAGDDNLPIIHTVKPNRDSSIAE